MANRPREKNGRFRRSRRGTVRHRLGSIRRRTEGTLGAIRRRTTGAFRGLPPWAKPSNVAAGTGVAVGLGTLIFTPLANGDSWQARLKSGYATYRQSKNPLDLLCTDADGNDATTIAVAQLKQNAVPAIGYTAGFGLIACALRYFGM